MTTMNEREISDWNRLLAEGMYQGDDVDTYNSNVKYSFDKMCVKYGKAYIEYLKAAWLAKDELPEHEWASLNGNVPKSFINKHLKRT